MEKNQTPKNKLQFSYSKLHLFNTCPRQYYYRYLDDTFKTKPTIWPGNLVGQCFHKALETVVNLKAKNEDEQLIIFNINGKFKEWYEAEVELNKRDYKISKEVKMGKDKFYNFHDKLMVSFIKFILSYFYHFNSDPTELVSEQEHIMPWDFDKEIELTGFVDLLLKGPDYYKIFDLKVTKDPTTYFYIDWDLAMQKIIYEYFIYKLHGQFPVSFSYLVVDREEKSIFFKESFKTKTDLKNINVEKYFSILNINLKTLKEYTIKPDLSLAYPTEEKCKWCIPYNTKCDLKYQSAYVRAARKIKK